MTGQLERRYRALLRILPTPYRRAWGEEMVAAFLESVQTGDPDDDEYLVDYGRPPLPEAASVIALGIRLRLGASGAPSRYLAWGEAIRRVALVGLLAQAIFGAVEVGFRLWLAGEVPWAPAPPADWLLPMPDNRWLAAWQLAGLVSVTPLLALLYGFRRQALALAAVAVLVTAVRIVVDMVATSSQGVPPAGVALGVRLLFDGFLLATLAAFHADAPPVRRRPWLVGLAAGVVVVPLVSYGADALVFSTSLSAAVLFDGPGLWCLAVVAGALVHLAARALGRPAPAWSLALAVLAAGVVAYRLLDLLQYVAFDVPDLAWVLGLGVAQAAAVAAVGLALAALAGRTVGGNVDGGGPREVRVRTGPAGG